MIKFFFSFLSIIYVLGLGAASAQELQTTEDTLKFVEQQQGYQKGMALNPQIIATEDGRSFVSVWQPNPKTPPKHWLVSIHGSNGNALQELAVWYPTLKDSDVGLITLQWWFGQEDYFRPQQIYSAVDNALTQLKLRKAHLIWHGFSRGASNTYAVAALDRSRPEPLFSLYVANAGGYAAGYPPNRMIGDNAFLGSEWVLSCGEKDPNPNRDGCPKMKETGEFIKNSGGKVLRIIEDPNFGHGSLNANPENALELVNMIEGNK